MTMLRRRGAWSRMTNISDRDIVISLLRSAGHGDVLDRNVDLILSSKVKIDVDGNVVELALGKNDQSSIRFQQQRRQRQRRRWRPIEGNHNTDDNDDDDVVSYWDLPESTGKLRHLRKLVLCHCRSFPTSLNELQELKCLELHFCHGITMLHMQQSLNSSTKTQDNHGVACKYHSLFPYLKMLEINGGIWDAQSIFWLKYIIYDERSKELPSEETHTITHLEVVRFSFLQDELRNAILNFLSPFKMGKAEDNNGSASASERARRTEKVCALPTSRLKRLVWAHSGMTDQGLEMLLLAVVMPYHPNLSSIDVSGNQIRSLQFLLDDNEMYRTVSIGDVERNKRKTSHSSNIEDDGELERQKHHDETFYHPLRTLNLQHNPVLRYRTSHCREQEAFELLLRHFFPLLGSLTPSWENWDTRIEYLLRINRGGRVLVEGNVMPPSLASLKWRSNGDDDGAANTQKDQIMVTAAAFTTVRNKETKLSKKLVKKKIHLSVWALVLHRAYKTSPKGFLPPLEDATAMYYLIRNGPALSEIFAATTR